jgi:hypothetical protein
MAAFADRQLGAAHLIALAEEKRPQGGTMAELLIETLANRPSLVPPEHTRTTCLILSDVMDDIERDKPPGDFGRRQIWSSARRLLDGLLVETFVEVGSSVEQMVREGRALGWLAETIRTQHHLSRRDPNEQALFLKPSIADEVYRIFRERCSSAGPALIQTPDMLTLLWAWLEAGGGDQAKSWCASQTQAPEGLIALLEKMRGWRSTNGRVEHPIRRREVAQFLDFDNARMRIESIAKASGPLADRARALRLAFERADDEREIPF